MKLADLRRLAIRKRLKIHFKLRNGAECVVNDAGIAQVPALQAIPDFNLEEELAAAGEFLLEPEPPARPRTLSRAEIAALAADSPLAAAAHDREED